MVIIINLLVLKGLKADDELKGNPNYGRNQNKGRKMGEKFTRLPINALKKGAKHLRELKCPVPSFDDL